MINPALRWFRFNSVTVLLLALLWNVGAHAASVGPAGYTNDFTTQPAASDWGTVGIRGGPSDVYDLDNDVVTNAMYSAAVFTFQPLAFPTNLPAQLTNATWSSTGGFLQTRPNAVRATALMGKFINNTGTNAAEIRLAYQLQMAGTAVVEDAGKGTHVYYSLSGVAGSWVPLPTLNNLTNTGTFNLSTNLPLAWADGANLFVLWVDDNTAVGVDAANQLDGFSLTLPAGAAPALGVNVTAPTNGVLILSGPPTTLSAAVAYGTPPHTVQYFTNSGAGNTVFASAGTVGAPFNLSLGVLPAATYHVYAVVTDSSGGPAIAGSVTNTFTIVDTISITLASPANGASIETSVPVSATAGVMGGTTPYAVQFFLDGASNGPALTTPPFTRNFGPLNIADHTISATVTDARGWVSNSPVHTVHITGPLSVSLAPTNGATVTLGQPLVFTASPVGGTAPYTITFYTNGQVAGVRSSAPYTLDLGVLPQGSYTSTVHAVDSTAPTPQQTDSSVNVITVSAPPLLAALTAPAAGQVVNAGQSFNVTATASVGTPFSVSNVQFFVDGVAVGTDSSAPYSAPATVAVGSHTAYAVALDNIGRQTFTATNAFTAIIPPNASLVGPAGYTNDFSTQPAAVEWSTISVAGAAGDTYVMDTEVNAVISQLTVTNRPASVTGDPAAAAALAVWNSAGLHLQMRPTGNRYSLLLARFLNQSGTNASQVRVSYLFTIAAGGVTEETGARGYYSLSGLPGTWTNITEFNTLSSTAGSTAPAATLSVNWTNGGNLYFAWADDNASGQGTDSANQFDNFSLLVTAGEPPAFGTRVTAPAANALFVSGNSIEATATVASGTSPYTVEFFLNNGGGFTSAGVSATGPYTVSLGALTAGDYNIYSVATDSSLATTNSLTNTFRVANVIAFNLTAPADNTTVDNLTPVTGRATVAGGTPPYAVQFFLDNNPSGAADTSAPYERNFGALLAGDHLIRATVTDARGWASNTLVSTVHVTGPLGAALLPVDGASFLFGSSITLTGVLGGGSAPYTAEFFLNSISAGVVSAPPYFVPLGILSEGSYAGHIVATDSSAPTPQHYTSATNVFTILPNPLTVALTAPTNGASGVVGVPVALTATAGVSAPLTVTAMEFYLDGALAVTDASAPFGGSVTVATAGAHTFAAVAVDNLGRRATSAVNTVTFIVDPLVNNDFANAILLGTPANLAGNNTGANTQQGEPTFQSGSGQTTILWGATLWYRWVAPFNGTVTMATLGSTLNTVLSVYTGAAVNGLTLVQRNDDTADGGTASLVSFAAVAGTTYQIQVGGFQTGFGRGAVVALGPFQLNLTMPAFVSITNPVAGAAFTIGTPIPVDVIASSTIGTVTNVSLYRGNVFIGSDDTAPYAFVVNGAPAGSNALYAVAQDSNGQSSTSGVVRVFVANIGLTFTAPTDGAVLTGTNPVTASVFTAPISGAITNVNFFIDGIFLASDTVAPFSATWTNVTGGSHRFAATGRDDAGNSYVATPVNFGVAFTLIASNSNWRYLDNGSDQGTNWMQLAFDDSGWSNGLAELGYGDGDEATVVQDNGTPGYVAGDTDRYTTTYFRRRFTVANPLAFTALNFALERDDAAVVHLNGREIFRVNLPAAPVVINYTTLGLSGIEDTLDTFSINPTNLVAGDNILAVEIHQQSANSSDISFNLDLQGQPVIIYNLLPAVAFSAPTNTQSFLAPASIALAATASDDDGVVTNVAFFVDGVKLGDDTTTPYEFTWNSPTVAAHVLTAVATDDLGGTKVSASVNVVVYDALGTPVAAVTSPANGAVMEGPTNLLITATANALNGVTNVEFLANGTLFGTDATPPYSAVWSSTFLLNQLQAVAVDANGVRGTSPVVSITITIPPTNVLAPTIVTQIPLAYATITNLTNLTIRFSERVQGVDASDLLINGLPASSVFAPPNGSNYVFAFPHPPYGPVDISFASGHGITDFGFPSNLAFNAAAPEASWSYTLIDQTPPRVSARTPVAGATVTNLSEIAVTFSENVIGVSADDLLLNGVPAFAFSGSGSNYTFNVEQPASGTMNVTWATNHNIADFADLPNSFVRTATGNPWSFTLDTRTTFISSNSLWRFIKGTAEASDPTNAWRQLGYNDSGWSNSAAPFFYGDPYTNFARGIFGTHLTDMRSNYSSIYLRREFTVLNAGAVTNLLLNAQSDDGFIACLNGVEVLRVNVAGGSTPFNGIAVGASAEPGNVGAGYVVYTLTNNAAQHLVSGVNVLSVHALNENLSTSSDFGFNAQLYSFLADFAVVAPRLANAVPAPGDVFYLTNIVITFSESVTNVDAADLLVNGVPASSVTSDTNTTYSFSFAQPPYGAVAITWATNNGIVDFDATPKSFDGTAVSARPNYLLVNPSAPLVAARAPIASISITGLTSITVTFTEPVTGVDAGDLLINGAGASGVSANSTSEYVFTFAQPGYGAVSVRFATNSGITDLEVPATPLDATRPANQWSYTLVNPRPTVVMTAPVTDSYVLVGANVPLAATTSDNDGFIVSVQYFESNDGQVIGLATNAPFGLTFSNVQLGTYVFRAIATDNTGLTATSAPVVLNVVTSLPIALLRGPYLQGGSPTGGVVRWRTDLFSDAVLRYGTDRNFLTNVATESALTNNHLVRIIGLEPATKYFYAFGSSAFTLAGGTNATGSNYWFNTAPVIGSKADTRFWVLGDPGTANANQRAVRDAYYNMVTNGGKPADVWLMLGDNAYNTGTDTEHQSAVFNMYPDTLRNKFLYPVIGNHDAGRPGDGGGLAANTNITFPYLDIWSTPRNGEGGGLASGSAKYYSFDHGNIHFIGLDSMTSGRETNSPMILWLQDDLANTAQDWIIVFFHHSLYTKGTHNSDTETDLIALRQLVNPILDANGVDLVLMGHSHVYERSYLLDGHYGLSTTLTESMKLDGGNGREGGTNGTGAYVKNEENRGTIYSIVGSSGQAPGGGALNHPAHFVSLSILGSLVVDVSSNRLDAFFLTSTGATNDTYTLRKRTGSRPLSPTNVLAHAIGTNTIQVTWTDAATNEFGYYIDRSTDGTNYTRLGTNSVNSTSFLDNGLPAGVTFFYRVIAYNGAGESGGSGASSFTGNNAPTLAAIPNVIADVLHGVFFTALGSDTDLPANQLSYALLPGAPTGATIHPSNAVFRWLPSRADAATTNAITVRVTDNGTPPLNASRAFTVVVRDYFELGLGSAVLEAGQTVNVRIDLTASAPLTNLSFTLALPPGRFSSVTLDNLVPAVASASLSFLVANVATVQFTALPGQTIGGTQLLARLNFTAVPVQSSAFVPLHLDTVTAQRATSGLAPTALLNDGRLVIVNGQPLLEAALDRGGSRSLTLYGQPGTNYVIETTGTPSNPASWTPLLNRTPASLQETISIGNSSPAIFYRARQAVAP